MILSAKQCSCQVEDKILLDQVDFEVEAGLRYAVIGPNGAGKSTLLKALCRLMPLSAGDCILSGKKMSAFSQRDLATWISYVSQTVFNTNGFTVHEFVLMGRYPHLSPFTSLRKTDRDKVDAALEMTGMQTFAQRRLDTLSGGERQKVMIAAAMVQEARIMLLDEPTAFLDPLQQDQVYALLETIRARTRVTLIEVTHDVNRAALSHDIILGLRQGRVVFCGTPEELMQPEVLYAIYGKHFTFARHPENNCQVVMPTGKSI
ncbi:ABC transporter ATP-binding protein [bacterium]|nr:ABC transporter ATP-binding protein [bacterium]